MDYLISTPVITHCEDTDGLSRTRTNLYLDCEWNDWLGDLISMALVGEDGQEWYEVVGCSQPSAWVAEHVMPCLNKPAVTSAALRDSLQKFLSQYESVTIVADWPEDIAHICSVIVFAPGIRISTPDLHFHCWRGLEGVSALPHNALEDARANMVAAKLGQTPALVEAK